MKTFKHVPAASSKEREVLRRLCALSSEVGEALGIESHDCFCKNTEDPFFQFDLEIMKFIEDAVHGILCNKWHPKKKKES